MVVSLGGDYNYAHALLHAAMAATLEPLPTGEGVCVCVYMCVCEGWVLL